MEEGRRKGAVKICSTMSIYAVFDLNRLKIE